MGMPDKPPDKIPTFEEFVEAMGPDAMSFMHDMVSPDDPDEHGDADEYEE